MADDEATTDVEEYKFFHDDCAIVAKMLKDCWSLGDSNRLNISYEVEKYITDSRVGAVFVYPVSSSNRIASIDYQTVDRTTRIGIKVDNRARANHFIWCNEVYRILYANRRLGRAMHEGYSEVIIDGTQTLPNESGWYTTTFNVTLISRNMPIRSAGFGDNINTEVGD